MADLKGVGIELPKDDDDYSTSSSDDSSVDSDADLTTVELWQKRIKRFLDSMSLTILMAVVTIYALFGDDMRMWLFSSSADETFMVLSSIAFVLFLLELFLSIFAKTEIVPVEERPAEGDWLLRTFGVSGYFGSFFFWLDLVAAISLMPEVTWLWGPLTGTSDDDQATDLTNARAGRASRSGSKAGRVVRMVRLVRLVKLYSVLRARQRGERVTEVQQSNVGARLSELTTRRVIVVVLCMLICVPLFSFNDDDFSEEFATEYTQMFNIERQPFWNDSVHEFAEHFSSWDDGVTKRLVYLDLAPKDGLTPDLSQATDGAYLDLPIRHELRSGLQGTEVKKVIATLTHSDGLEYRTEAWFSQTPLTQEEASLSLLLTVFVICLLTAGSYFFSSDAQKLVLRPIEHMVLFVKRMASDPLTEISSKDNTGQFETSLLENTIKKIGGLLRVGFGRAGASIIAKNLQSGSQFDPMVEGRMMHAIFGFIAVKKFNWATNVLQTNVLLFINKISKIVHDVTLEWGGAPNKNLGEGYLITWVLDTSKLIEEDIAALRGGRRPSASTLSTTALGAGAGAGATPATAMNGGGGGAATAGESKADGVSDGASIASGGSDKRASAGAVASAFQTPTHGTTPAATGSRKEMRSSKRKSKATMSRQQALMDRLDLSRLDLTRMGPDAARVADRAMVAFLKIIGEVSRSRDLLDSDEMYRLQDDDEHYRIYMQYGLHVGWAIEGAIGSIHKVDASYLSPNVNIAARMYAAAAQYGVPLLMSGEFVKLLSEKGRRYIRKLDVVKVKGSDEPLGVWTYDIWEWKYKEPARLMSFDMFVKYCDDPDVFNRNQTYIPTHKRRISVLGPAKIVEHPVTEVEYDPDVFDKDSELIQFRMPFTDDFRHRHQKGVDAYIRGDWAAARTILEGTFTDENLPHAGGDGPSRTILNVMKKTDYKAPPGWPGWRALTEK